MTSISDVAASGLSKLALAHWPSADAASSAACDGALVRTVYDRYLMPSDAQSSRTAGAERVSPRQLLEYSSYLEFYLWPHFSDSSSFEHAMSIILVSGAAAVCTILLITRVCY